MSCSSVCMSALCGRAAPPSARLSCRASPSSRPSFSWDRLCEEYRLCFSWFISHWWRTESGGRTASLGKPKNKKNPDRGIAKRTTLSELLFSSCHRKEKNDSSKKRCQTKVHNRSYSSSLCFSTRTQQQGAENFTFPGYMNKCRHCPCSTGTCRVFLVSLSITPSFPSTSFPDTMFCFSDLQAGSASKEGDGAGSGGATLTLHHVGDRVVPFASPRIDCPVTLSMFIEDVNLSQNPLAYSKPPSFTRLSKLLRMEISAAPGANLDILGFCVFMEKGRNADKVWFPRKQVSALSKRSIQ